jgi:secondary thiamine-phosphate synthase enzyme
MIVTVKTSQRTQLVDITSEIERVVAAQSETRDGWCLLYVPHTTAAVTINESADPAVRADIADMLDKLIPWKAGYRHMEGNSAAHIKSTLVGASEMVAIEGERLVLGTWQGIFFCEFDGPRTRKIHVHVYGK